MRRIPDWQFLKAAVVTSFLLMGTLAGSPALAQRWTIDPKTSLAWWQLNPHLGHLWATTCPQDPDWQPGESRGHDRGDISKRKEVGITSKEDPRIPLYPREKVDAICSEAVSGELTVPDTVRYSGVKGLVRVKVEYLYNGMEMRDEFAKKAIYSADEYPEVRFYIDSLSNVQRGDTLRGNAVGRFELRGVRTLMTVPLEAWREPAGLRVRGKFSFPADQLTSVYKVSKFSLGLGIGTDIWKTLNLGFDVILLREAGGRSS